MRKKRTLFWPDVIVVRNHKEMAWFGALFLAEEIRNHPNMVMGLATGGTYIYVYRWLTRFHRELGLDFSGIATANLDEYLGLPPSHPQSYRYFMDQHLFSKVNIRKENIHFLNGVAPDPNDECTRFENAIKAKGRIKVQALGLGENGHIAFNEPGSPEDSRIRVVELTQNTIEANARFFAHKQEVPRKALTMGIANVLEAEQILILASGRKKARAVAMTLKDPPRPEVPASFLRKHPKVTFIIDSQAATMLLSKRKRALSV